ncbi:MAG: helix-turn-helix domain-containing protein [Sinobacteraceae bacterium]|nr:helix-turn-helix domain-containing protein [Nevskiaceae bacterium]
MSDERPLPNPPPVAAMVEDVLGCKWSLRLLERCAERAQRPSELLRACPGLSVKVMNERLRKLQRFGLLAREVQGRKPPLVVHYRLTPFGRRFKAVLAEIRALQLVLDARAQSHGPDPERNSTG